MTDGYLLINKPPDWTSFDVVKKVRNTLKVKKVGHTGTLDPFATGLLIILVGSATKQAQTLTDMDKVYIAKGIFGTATDTGDITGKVINTDTSANISREDIFAKSDVILSINSQTPPNYSAIKINGRPAYELARKNIDVQLPPRDIKIYSFELLDFNYPYFTYKVHVSKGTYIRTLTEQIAALFGTVATTVELQRVKVGDFDLKDAIIVQDVTVERINPLSLEGKGALPEYAHRGGMGDLERPILTLGSFDGLHLGHQFVLKETIRIASEHHAPAIVITFSQHPRLCVVKHQDPFLLTDNTKRDQLIKEIGIHHIENLIFNEEMASMAAYDFLKMIVEKYHPQAIVVGYDTHFGKGREGNADFLCQHAEALDFKVYKLPLFTVEGTAPASTLIRQLLTEGKVDEVVKYLGRPFSLAGKVVKGKQLGTRIDFPTINLLPFDKLMLIPASGVYFTYALVNGGKYYGVTNIGTSPTLKSENIVQVETHLLDFSGEVYGAEVEVFFLKRLRDEKRFDNAEDLIQQIKTDISQIVKLIDTVGSRLGAT